MAARGVAFIHGGGDFVEFNLGPGETIQVDTGCVVAFDESVHYDVQFAGGIKTGLFGGEGLFLATLQGPGNGHSQVSPKPVKHAFSSGTVIGQR